MGSVNKRKDEEIIKNKVIINAFFITFLPID